MVTHSSILDWRIPWTEKPGRLQSMGSQRVGHHGATSLSLSLVAQMVKSPLARRPGFDLWVRKIPWRRIWLLTPVFWPGESHGQRRLAGCSPQGHRESDMTEVT